jgi:hypothetical protein
MDLSRIGERTKKLRVEPVNDRLLRFRASLEDWGHSPDGDELIHSLVLEGTISIPELEILSIEPTTLHQPYAECLLSVEPVRKLVGARIGPGFRTRVIELLGRTKGCTHYLTLALDLAQSHTLATFLRMRSKMSFEGRNSPDGAWIGTGLEIEPLLENACIGLRTESPVIQRAKQYRERKPGS